MTTRPVADVFADWVDADPDWERLAPVHDGAIVLRLRPRGWAAADPRLDRLNEELRAAANATGEVFLGREVVDGHTAVRLAIADRPHAERAWGILRAEALRLGATPPAFARPGP